MIGQSIQKREEGNATSRRDFLALTAAVAAGSLCLSTPAGQYLAQEKAGKAKEKGPDKELKAKVAKVRERLRRDAAFRESFKKDPVKSLGEFQISRDVATNLVATDLGVKAASDWCICTGCCCTGCCVSRSSVYDRSVLPAATDQKAWARLAKGATP